MSDIVGRNRRAGMLAFSLALAAGGPALAASANAGAPEVLLNSGPIVGLEKGGIYEYLGIPYAKPPVGALRWRPSEPVTPWTNVVNATAFGPTCAQITEFGVFAGPANTNEDCLYLNVYVPKSTKGANALPVLVWVHGGGLYDGESNDYDGSALASRGPAIVVTINYRLGLLGFLAVPALDRENHPFANYGVLDQQLALQWVRQNAAAFGGDANNVTLGGQSSGASSAGANILSPAAAGLFDRAILMSGSAYLTPAPLPLAEVKGTAFSVAAGCGDHADRATAACLRALTAAQIIALQGTPSANGPYVTGMVLDGQILPLDGLPALQSGRFNHVPIINGSVQDEGNFSIGISEYFTGPPREPITAAQFTTYVTNVYSGNAGPGGGPPHYPPHAVQAVMRHYPLSAYATPQLALDAVETDPTACRIHKVNEVLQGQVPVYAYEFDDRTAPYYFPKMPAFVPLAAHTIDIQFVFRGYHGGPAGVPRNLDVQERALSDEMLFEWTNFAWTGNPNRSGASPWPAYTGNPDAQEYLLQNVPFLSTTTGQQFSDNHQCAFWDKLLAY